MPPKKTRKKGKKSAPERTPEELRAALDALTRQPASTITKAISESAGHFKTGRYEA